MTETERPLSPEADDSRPAWYITTAIPYVNAPPHIGFALEMLQGDVLARFRRAQGYDVRFQAGSDENSLKNVQAAEAAGITTADLVRRNAAHFVGLGSALNLTVDDFIRTSTDPRHRSGVEKLWRACAAKGDIYKKAYRGLYCIGCEQFYKLAELSDGLCPEHGTPAEEIAEENYFFRLARYQDALEKLIGSGELKVEPASRRNEVLRWIAGGLEDFSISRSSERAHGWGIPVPGDPGQVIYVWFDALANYITALDYGSGSAGFARYWCKSEAREHIVGKGITRFHALYWPAMLLSAGLTLPNRVLVHGYVTVEGSKIGKSAGNTVDPIPLADEFGSDALRYYLLGKIRSTEDGDYSRERFLQAYRSDLAGQLGNLANRTLSMIERYLGGVVPEAVPGTAKPSALSYAAERLPSVVGVCIERFAFHDALSAIWDHVAQANKYVADRQPWLLAKEAGTGYDGSALASAELRRCLLDLANSLCAIAQCLAPFLPATSDSLLAQFGFDGAAARMGGGTSPAGRTVRKGELLFPKLDG